MTSACFKQQDEVDVGSWIIISGRVSRRSVSIATRCLIDSGLTFFQEHQDEVSGARSLEVVVSPIDIYIHMNVFMTRNELW